MMPKNLTQKQIVIIGFVAVVLIVVGVVFFMNIRSNTSATQALNLTIWGTEDSKAFNDLINQYTGPGAGSSVTIKYTQMDPSTYQSTLLRALAGDAGPDIFEVPNRDVGQWTNTITPIPASMATTFNEVTLQNDFPNVVSQDFDANGSIYALPLYVDTMAMIYNKDLFDSAGIAIPPKTWSGFDADIAALRTTNAQGQITQAAAAIGGSETSIPTASDLVFLLMLQNGTQMRAGSNSTVAFAGQGIGSSATSLPGLAAFNFYLQFANAQLPYYTWNDSLGNAEDAFAQGKVAVIFDYAASLPSIRAKSPFLNIGIAPMPQPDNASGDINYAKYSGLAVNKNSPSVAGAWSFIIQLTTSLANANIYTKDTGLPPALRTAIHADLTDPNLAVFAAQALTARSWYETNSESYDHIMNAAIQNVLNGSSDSTAALTQAQSEMNNVTN